MTGAGWWTGHSEQAHVECVLGKELLEMWPRESSSSSCSLRRVALPLWPAKDCEEAQEQEQVVEVQHSGTIWVCLAAAMCRYLSS